MSWNKRLLLRHGVYPTKMNVWQTTHTLLYCFPENNVSVTEHWKCSRVSRVNQTLDISNVKHTVSLARSSSSFFANCTSSSGPFNNTLSLLDVAEGNRIMTPPHSSRTARINAPFALCSDACIECGMSTVCSVTRPCQFHTRKWLQVTEIYVLYSKSWPVHTITETD